MYVMRSVFQGVKKWRKKNNVPHKERPEGEFFIPEEARRKAKQEVFLKCQQ